MNDRPLGNTVSIERHGMVFWQQVPWKCSQRKANAARLALEAEAAKYGRTLPISPQSETMTASHSLAHDARMGFQPDPRMNAIARAAHTRHFRFTLPAVILLAMVITAYLVPQLSPAVAMVGGLAFIWSLHKCAKTILPDHASQLNSVGARGRMGRPH